MKFFTGHKKSVQVRLLLPEETFVCVCAYVPIILSLRALQYLCYVPGSGVWTADSSGMIRIRNIEARTLASSSSSSSLRSFTDVAATGLLARERISGREGQHLPHERDQFVRLDRMRARACGVPFAGSLSLSLRNLLPSCILRSFAL
jgi:hypothetical protein